MPFSHFTNQGILVGDVEFDIFSTISRWILVAFLCDLGLRLVFKHRIGVYLVVQLSALAGMRAWIANHQQHASTRLAKGKTCLLFLLAFGMTRGIDLLLSSSLSILRRTQAHQVAFVAAAVTGASSTFKTTFSSNVLIAIDRVRVYQALHDITKGSQLSGTWPESIGDLSDVEVASVTIAGGSVCMDEVSAQYVEATPQPAPAAPISALNRTTRGLSMPHSDRLPFFGESVHFAELFINHPSQKSQQLAYGYTIPFSTSYYIPRDGRSVASKRPRRHFGVISMPNNTLGSYDMECGLDMVGMSKWLVERLSQLGKDGAMLQFDDIHAPSQQGVTAATFTFTKNLSSEVEVLSFGVSFPKLHSASVYLNTPSTSKFLSRPVNGSRDHLSTSIAITSESAVSATCKDLIRGNWTVGTSVTLRDRLDQPLPGAGNPILTELPSMQECMLSFSPASNVTASLFNQPTSTQVCRSRVRRYNKITADIEAFQHFVSARYSTVVDRSMTVSCMQRAKESQSPSRPLLPLAIFSGKWGFLSEATVPSSIFETHINPKSSQVWLVSLVLFPWWLLTIVLAAALILVVFGGWGDLAEIVAAILYSYAVRPVPRLVAERWQFDWWAPDCPMATSIALSQIPLMERVEFALVRHHDVQNDRRASHIPPLEIRIVPRKWSLSTDEDISLERTGKETILELAQSFPRLMSVAKKRLALEDVQE